MVHRPDSENVVALQQTTSFIQQEPGSRQGFQQVTIGSLPDEVLLVIFYFFQLVNEDQSAWNRLVHVCQRWRYIIFESPIRLNLQLICIGRSRVRKSLDIWPPLPLVVRFCGWDKPWMDNIFAALEQRDRVCQIAITSLYELWNQIAMVMQKPFPTLRSLSLQSYRPFNLPDTLLNGSAPSLQDLVLQGINFPSLPRLLSSTSDLTSLHLFKIPDSGYILPEEMATSLSALPRLKSLIINFENFEASLLPYHKTQEMKQRSPPPTRFLLPALTQLEFQGMSVYLEFLAAQIDAPLLDDFQLTFLHQAILGFRAKFLFHIPQTIRFIGLLDSFGPSSITLEFKPRSRAAISFPSNQTCHSASRPSLSINCERFDWQVIFVTRICCQILPFRSRIKTLNIKCDWPLPWLDTQEDDTEIDSKLWSQLFDSFPSVQRLEIPAILESSITPALQGGTGESATKSLPSLHSLSVVGKKPVQQGIAA